MIPIRRVCYCAMLFCGFALGLGAVRAEIRLVAKGQLPGSATDQSGLVEILRAGNERIAHNRLGGFSALSYTGKEDLYWALSDRGPLDGAIAYACRVHLLKIVPPQNGQTLKVEVIATHLLKTQADAQLVGSAKAFDPLQAERSLRFDSEGLRVGRQGQLFISDEYGPSLYEFSAQGIRRRVRPLPAKLQIERPASDPDQERASNRSGRMPNGGMEGLAITPDGTTLLGIMQNPLIQDHGEHGLYLRIVAVPTTGGPSREYAYRLESHGLGVSEILAINDHQFLCLERDGSSGTEAAMKKIMQIDLTADGEAATDISQIAKLPKKDLPATIHAVKKKAFIDLLNPAYGLAGGSFPKKIESLTFGPRIGKKISLLICSDNDFEAAQPSQFYWFMLDEADLPGYMPQKFD